jgi:hypothetical protein
VITLYQGAKEPLTCVPDTVPLEPVSRDLASPFERCNAVIFTDDTSPTAEYYMKHVLVSEQVALRHVGNVVHQLEKHCPSIVVFAGDVGGKARGVMFLQSPRAPHCAIMHWLRTRFACADADMVFGDSRVCLEELVTALEVARHKPLAVVLSSPDTDAFAEDMYSGCTGIPFVVSWGEADPKQCTMFVRQWATIICYDHGCLVPLGPKASYVWCVRVHRVPHF